MQIQYFIIRQRAVIILPDDYWYDMCLQNALNFMNFSANDYMKRTTIILSALFIFLSVGELRAQEQKPYRAAATFKGDTARYLEYNYTIRSAQYKDKTVGEILKELEYPVLYVSGSMYRMASDMSTTQVIGLYLVIRQTGKKNSELKDYYIEVRFENPPTLDEYEEASGCSEDNPTPVFSKKLYDFIKDLKVSEVSSNQYILKDPERLKTRQRVFDRDRKEAKRAAEELRKRGIKGFDDL